MVACITSSDRECAICRAVIGDDDLPGEGGLLQNQRFELVAESRLGIEGRDDDREVYLGLGTRQTFVSGQSSLTVVRLPPSAILFRVLLPRI